jgi:hypothetical protein
MRVQLKRREFTMLLKGATAWSVAARSIEGAIQDFCDLLSRACINLGLGRAVAE